MALFLKLRARLWAHVESHPRRVVLFCVLVSFVLVGALVWRAIAILDERYLGSRRNDLVQTALGVTAVMDQEYHRLETLRQYGEVQLATQEGPDAVQPDLALEKAFAARNEPLWSIPLHGAGTMVGFGPGELQQFPPFVRNDDTLLADLYVGRILSGLLAVMVSEVDLESSGRFVSRNGFYVAVPADSVDPRRWLRRFASMPYFRDAMLDGVPRGRIARSPVYLAITNNEPVFSISTSLYCGSTFCGVVELDVNQRILERFLGRTKRGASQRILVAGNGDVIAISGAGVKIGQKWPRDFAGVWRSQNPGALMIARSGYVDAGNRRLLYQRVGDADMVLIEEVSDAQLARDFLEGLSWVLLGTVVASGLLLWVTLAVISRLFVGFLERGNALRALAEQDPLTGLANRRAFQNRFQLENEHRSRRRAPLSLLMVDADNFKQINDTWGHRNGDRVLVAMAGVCCDNLREVDLAARIGGEEFAVLLPGASLGEAFVVAERLRLALSKLEVEALANKEWPGDGVHRTITFTVSVGVAEMGADGADGLDVLVEVADRRLYQAKAMGRNRVVATDS
uniref:diguanylate cyclase n=1 Tax=Cupriavidus yeoncheonensis TaxID=1462994 RepID=UPI003F49337F